MRHDWSTTMKRIVLCLWATTLAIAAMFLLRGCGDGEGVVHVKVEVPTLTFVEK